MKRKILLVDDEVAVLLTLKAVLEISGYDVETAASAREGRHRLRTQEFDMVITDMRMESEAAGAEVIEAARSASYHPAVALLTAFPLADEDWQAMGADKMLVKPMQTRILLQQIEKLLEAQEAKLRSVAAAAMPAADARTAKRTAKPALKKRPAAKRAARRPAARKPRAVAKAGAKRAKRK